MVQSNHQHYPGCALTFFSKGMCGSEQPSALSGHLVQRPHSWSLPARGHLVQQLRKATMPESMACVNDVFRADNGIMVQTRVRALYKFSPFSAGQLPLERSQVPGCSPFQLYVGRGSANPVKAGSVRSDGALCRQNASACSSGVQEPQSLEGPPYSQCSYSTDTKTSDITQNETDKFC